MPRGDSLDTDPLPGGRGATPTQFYKSIVYTVKMGLRLAMPAEVLEYTAPVPGLAPALVKVRPHFKSAREIDNPAELALGEMLVNQADRLLAVSNLPDIPNRPVMYLGHSNMRMQGPIEVGEVGLYVVCDRSLDQWINTGGPLDPSTSELHDLTDGVFIPGLRYGTIAQVIPEDADTIGREDGTAGMSIDRATKDIAVTTDGPNATIDAASLIKLGALATEAITKAETLISVLDAVFAAGSAAGTGVPGTTGKLSFDAAVIAWNASKNTIKATKGRTE